MSKPSSRVLVLLNETIKSAPAVQLSDLARQARDELVQIAQMEGAAAVRALRFGIVMHHIKSKLDHGKFQPWLAANFTDVKYRQLNYYMRLAIVFADSMRLNQAEVFALPGAQLQLPLDGQDGATRSVLEKVAKFVGDLSLTELLIKHDIKSVGLKKELGEGAEDIDESNLPPDEVLRRRRDEIFGGTIEHLGSLHKVLTNTESLTLLDNTQLEAIENKLVELRAAIAAVRKTA